MKALSIYIHIPFCVRKCLYCDFLSLPVGEAGEKAAQIESYVNLLCREITQAARLFQKYQVISIFLGGGTPSLLSPAQLHRIMETVRAHYRLAADAEITVEINPGTLRGGQAREYITAGINRVSIGLQSADDGELGRIGRIHDYDAFLRTYTLIRDAGFTNVNIDLMSALPEQTPASYERTLDRVTVLAPEHISAYSLILEEGTPLYERQSQYRFPTEEEEVQMDQLTRSHLAACGYHRYEISNYAWDGYECRHNKVYWQRGDYVGFGLGAASMTDNVRWSNPASMDAYAAYVTGQAAYSLGDGSDGGGMQKDVVPVRQRLSRLEQMEEYMFLGLRMTCGVSADEFAHSFGEPVEAVYGDVLRRLCGQGLLVREADRIRLTGRGLDVSNYAMAQFLL